MKKGIACIMATVMLWSLAAVPAAAADAREGKLAVQIEQAEHALKESNLSIASTTRGYDDGFKVTLSEPGSSFTRGVQRTMSVTVKNSTKKTQKNVYVLILGAGPKGDDLAPVAIHPHSGVVIADDYQGGGIIKSLKAKSSMKLTFTITVPKYFEHSKLQIICMAARGDYDGADVKAVKIDGAAGGAQISETSALLEYTKFIYNGKACMPEEYVYVENTGKELERGKHYTVSYENNITPTRSAKVKLTGTGVFEGTKEMNFTIASIGDYKIKVSQPSIPGYKQIKLKWKTLPPGVSGYQILRADSKNGKYKKIATVKPGKEDEGTKTYTDKKVKAGVKYYYQIQGYVDISGQATQYSAKSDTVSLKAGLSKTTASAKNLAGRQIKVSWKKSDGAAGYQVYRAASKNGKYKKVKTVTKKSRTYYINTGRVKGKTYYYKVRAYRTVDGKKVYSEFSSVCSAKVKR